MSARPEILFPLFADLTALDGVGPKTGRLFARMDIARPVDLAADLAAGAGRPPAARVDPRPRPAGRSPRSRSRSACTSAPPRAAVPTASMSATRRTEFQLVCFHPREDWLRRELPAGARRIVSGRVELFDGIAQMVHPDHVLRPGGERDPARVRAGLSADPGPDPAPGRPGRGRRAGPRARAARSGSTPRVRGAAAGRPGAPRCVAAHAPAGAADLAPTAPARARLAYDELFAHQVTLALARAHMKRPKGFETRGDGALRARALAALPYAPTAAQTRAVAEITADMADAGADEPAAAGRRRRGQDAGRPPRDARRRRGGRPGGADGPDRDPRAPARGLARAAGRGRGRAARAADRPRQGRPSARPSSPPSPPARSRSWSAPTRCSRRTWPSATCASPSSTSSTASACASAWTSGPRARPSTSW